jgi:hypothetical protein
LANTGAAAPSLHPPDERKCPAHFRPHSRLLRADQRLNLEGGKMIDLYSDKTGELLGPITESDLKVLVDALEEESTGDRDYFIDAATIDVIADGRATEYLVSLLRKALGDSDGVDIRWAPRDEQ